MLEVVTSSGYVVSSYYTTGMAEVVHSECVPGNCLQAHWNTCRKYVLITAVTWNSQHYCSNPDNFQAFVVCGVKCLGNR